MITVDRRGGDGGIQRRVNGGLVAAIAALAFLVTGLIDRAQVTPGRDTGYAPRDEPGDAIEVDFVGPTTGYSDAFSFRDSG